MSGHHATSAVVPGEPPHIHHMDTPTAYEAAKLGMWLFLATEILLFGGLFAAFAIYRWYYFAEFHHASSELSRPIGAFNTVVLILSSFFAALAVDAAQHSNNRKCRNLLWGTVACGGVFLLVKTFEWTQKFHHGLFPASPEFNTPEFIQAYKSFFGLYYCMTGLHALHVVIGMAVLTWAALLAGRNRFSGRYYTPVEIGALYWHLVDLIWIYLFPLLYLVG